MHIINAAMAQPLSQDDKLSFLRPGKVERTTVLKRICRDLIWLMAHTTITISYYHQQRARSLAPRRRADPREMRTRRSPGRLANQQ